MAAATRRHDRVVAALVTLLVLAAPVVAQTAEGLVVPVPSPATSDVLTRIQNRVDAARKNPDRRPSVVIFDFNPQDKDANTPVFGDGYELAKYISGLHDVQTVAYVHKKVSGHAVLAVLACQQIVVGPSGVIGDVAAGKPLAHGEVNAYREFVGQARPAHVPLALKLFDPNVQVRKGKKAGAEWYIDFRQHADAQKAGIVVTDNVPPSATPDGVVATLNATHMLNLGLAAKRVESQTELLDLFGLTAASLRDDDPFGGKAPVAFRFVLQGQVDGGTKEGVIRVLKDVARQKGNVLFLQLECAGGDLQAARDLAAELQKQRDELGVLVVAFIPDKAPDTAAVIALGCSEIVMSKRKDAGAEATEAEFGDFEQALGKGAAANIDFLVTSLRELAEAQGYPPVLVDGMLKKEIEIVRVYRKDNRNIRRLMTQAEADEEKAKPGGGDWKYESTVKPKGQYLKLTASGARDLGVARHVTETRNPNDLYAKYGVEPGKVKDAAPAWLDQFASFLRIPAVTVLLVVIGFTGLILELKVPGTTIPGIVAALCFILVFWAHTQFSGQVAVLAGLLFILGIILVLLEVFVLPGFGAPGIVGVLLMLGSLALVTLGDPGGGVPDTTEEWGRFGWKVAQYLLALIGAFVSAIAIARYLPNIPYANKLMLVPPTEKVGSEAEVVLPGAAQAAALLGAVGTALTVLRPAGTVKFGDDFVDVVTEGGYIPAGARVQVVEVEGTRIVVKEV